jgi:hypothetical protein
MDAPPPGFVGWIQIGVYILGVAVLVSWLIQIWLPKKKEETTFKPQPLIVKQHDEYVTKEEFNEHVSAMNQDLANMRREATEGRRNLHRDIEAMPQKVIALLRDTKGLLQ